LSPRGKIPNLNRVFPNRTTTEDASSLSPPLLFVPSRSIRSSPRESEKKENKKISPPPHPSFHPVEMARSVPFRCNGAPSLLLVGYLFLFRYASYRTHFYYHFPCSIPVQPFFPLVFLSGDFPPCLQRRVILLASSSSSSLPSSLSLSLSLSLLSRSLIPPMGPRPPRTSRCPGLRGSTGCSSRTGSWDRPRRSRC